MIKSAGNKNGQSSPAVNAPPGKAPWSLSAGVFLVSFSLLALETSLTRVLSVILSYHYVFAVISLALLGLGLGAVLAYRLARRFAGENKFRFLAVIAGMLSLSIPVSLILTARISGESIASGILLYIPLLFLPFFLGGVLVAAVFRLFPEDSSRLYGADLLGGATGAIDAVLLLNALGGPRTIAAISAFALAAAALFTVKASGFKPVKLVSSAAGILVVLSLLGTAAAATGLADAGIGRSHDKEINTFLGDPSAGGKIVETKWSAFGRTDLVSLKSAPDQMLLFTDGTAGSAMYKFDGDFRTAGRAIQGLKTEFPGYISLLNLKPGEKNTALIIGPGGGRDVLLALMTGIKEITAVEVNKDIVDIVREYSGYNGGIYDRENVRVVVDEGRNFLKRQQDKYDVIMLSLPITKTSRSVEGFALTENYLFTIESINDYLSHLNDGGELLVVAHTPVEVMQLVSMSLKALEKQGVNDEEAMKRLYVIGNHHYPAFVLKKTPFDPVDLLPIHQDIHSLNYDATMSFLPTIKAGSCTTHESGTRFDECGMLNPVLIGLNQGDINLVELMEVFAQGGINIRPATDDSPFFYKTDKGIPAAITVIFWLSIVTLLAVITAVLTRRETNPPKERQPAGRFSGRKPLNFTGYFAALGIGFMLVEISIFQKFTLFLGQPVLSLAVLVSSLLVGGGLGSLFSGRFAARPANAITIVSLAIVAVLTAYAFAMPAVFEKFLGAGLAIRMLIAIIMVVPLGFLMGFPFPTGLRLLKESGAEDYVPWMWAVNGVGSVVGSVATIVIAMTSGFTTALMLGAACYLGVCLLSRTMKSSKPLAEKRAVQPAA